MGKESVKGVTTQEQYEQIELDAEASYAARRNMSQAEMDDAVRSGSVPHISSKAEAVDIAKTGGWEVDALMTEMEREVAASGAKKSVLDLEFSSKTLQTLFKQPILMSVQIPSISLFCLSCLPPWVVFCLVLTNRSSLVPICFCPGI